MAPTLPLLGLALLGLAAAQTPGKSPEVHPKVFTYRCTKAGGCLRRTSAVVLDSGTHWIHQRDDPSLGCTTASGALNTTVCPDQATCAKNCIIEGISDYASHGVTTSGDSINLEMLVNGNDESPRIYLLSETQDRYEMLKLTGNEISYDVDVSKLPCGMNGALYLSEMAERGGQGPLNKAGAVYGTGYCDAQCGTETFINGAANLGGYGACCAEMDIWEANSAATQLTPHTCNETGLYQCTPDECAFDGVCDKYGCGMNPYGLGDHEYYGPGLKVDTSRPFTVVTQFPAVKNKLTEIRRLYVQDGKVIQNAYVNYTGPPDINYIDQEYCTDTGATRFLTQGGMEGMGEALHRGMVLIFSIWWDAGGYMTWLDTGSAGPCSVTSGDPTNIVAAQPNPAVTFSAIKWGEIGSTFSGK